MRPALNLGLKNLFRLGFAGISTAAGYSRWRFRTEAARRVIPGLSLHVARMDKSWSLTDCISFYLMRERGITQALTTDHHFTQAGFEALLRRDPS